MPEGRLIINYMRPFRAVLCGLLMIGWAIPGLTQDEAIPELEAIVVTAEKIEEPLQKVPRSASVVTSDLISGMGVTSVKEASFLAPNMNIVEFSARKISFPIFRGVGAGTANPAVGTFIDGVPQQTIDTGNINLLDVERIEFIRGPLGTLYGRTALAGAINIITRKPTWTPEFSLEAGGGDFNSQHDRFSASGPVIPGRLAVRVSGARESRDGFKKNTLTGNDLDSRKSFAGRIQALWLPHDRWRVHINAFGEQDRDGGFVIYDLDKIRKKPMEITNDFEGSTDRDVLGPSMTVKYKGASLEVTSVTALQWWRAVDNSDTDFSEFDIRRRWSSNTQRTISEELRLASRRGSDIQLTNSLSLKWLTGISVFQSVLDEEAYNETRPLGVFLPFFPLGKNRTEAKLTDSGLGLFGQTTFTAIEKLDLTTGIRYENESKKAELASFFESAAGAGPKTIQPTLKDTFQDWIPRISLAYRATPDLMPYISLTKGFRAGGYDQNAPRGEEAYAPETSWAYETGIKTSWMDGQIILNAALYQVDWKDMQVFVAHPSPFVLFYIKNAGKSRSRGGELELRARPLEGLELISGIGTTDTEYVKYTDEFGVDVKGKSMTNAPAHTWNTGLLYSVGVFDGPVAYLGGNVHGMGPYFFDAANTEKQKAYQLVNIKLGLRGHHWRVELWAKNVLDKTYIPVAFKIPSPPMPSPVFFGETGPPRTIGATVGINF